MGCVHSRTVSDPKAFAMNTSHAHTESTSAGHGVDQRFLWRVLLAAGGIYLAVKLFRGLGGLFWTVFGLAFGLVWMLNGRGFPW
jgi:hypothetical protein